MSEIEHTRTLGKVHQYSNTKILLLAGFINKMSTADVREQYHVFSDVIYFRLMLGIYYSAEQP